MPRPKNDGLNRSEKIREIVEEYPHLKPSEIVDALADRGIEVKLHLVYAVLSKMKDKGAPTRRRRAVASAPPATAAVAAAPKTSENEVVTTIKKVRSLAAEVGGLDELKALVEALSE